MIEIEGRYFPPGSSAARPARLTASGHGTARLTVGPEELESVIWPDAVEVSDRVGNIPRRVALPDGATFVTDDNDAIDRWLGLAGRRRVSWLAKLEAVRPRLIVVAALLLAGVVAMVIWGVPYLAEAAARLTPQPVLRQIGEAALALHDGRLLRPSVLPAARRDAVRAAFDRLARTAGLDEVADLHFRSGPLGANALALPGAVIVVTDDLVHLLGDEGTAAVLSHELAHAELRHPARGIYQAAGLALLLLVVAGDLGGMVEEAAGLGLVALERGYSRDFERAADSRGVTLLAAAGFAPSALRGALTRLAAACGTACEEAGWLSSHPAMSERLRRLPAGD